MKLLNIERNGIENSKQYTYRVLKENIMNLNLYPGESISEAEISKILKISRTPIREAIVKLSEEELISVFPQKGSYVSKIDLDLVKEAVFLRNICEEKILEIAIESKNNILLIKELERNLEYQKLAYNLEENTEENIYKIFSLDNEFHKSIYDFCNKKNIWKSIKRLSSHYDRIRLLDTIEKNNILFIIKQHEEIIKIIKEENLKAVHNLVSSHLVKFEDLIEFFREKYSDYFLQK